MNPQVKMSALKERKAILYSRQNKRTRFELVSHDSSLELKGKEVSGGLWTRGVSLCKGTVAG